MDEFYVVTGYQGHQVRNFLAQLEERLAIRITPLVNEDWEKEMGLTATFPKVLKEIVKQVLHEEEAFLLPAWRDHLFESR